MPPIGVGFAKKREQPDKGVGSMRGVNRGRFVPTSFRVRAARTAGRRNRTCGEQDASSRKAARARKYIAIRVKTAI